MEESKDKLKEVEKEKKGAAKKNEKLHQEVDELCQRVEALEKEVIEKVYTIKVKDNACMKFKKQKEELENRFNKALQEPKTEVMKKFKCESCDFFAESTVRLSHHIKRNHFKDQTCQTSNLGNSEKRSEWFFSEYSCFYCGYIIWTNESLQKHISECHETGEVIIKKIENCRDPKELNMNEALESYLSHIQTITARVLKCDICQETFEYETLFGLHKIFTHPGWANSSLKDR